MADTQSSPISGQSGTEYEPTVDGADRPNCPCGALHNPLRGTITELQSLSVRIRVDELLGSTTGFEIGGEIEGRWWGTFPCFVGCPSVAVGDEVLAFYRPEAPCVQAQAVECALGDTIPAEISLAPWAERVVLARVTPDYTVSVSDLRWLDAPVDECVAALGRTGDFLGPDDVETACHDTSAAP